MARRRETAVFLGTETQRLRYRPNAEGEIAVFGPSMAERFERDVDYVVDAAAGCIRRTAASAIPDWREHPLYGNNRFDHREVPSYSNAAFTCTIEYEPMEEGDEAGGAAESVVRRLAPTKSLLSEALHRRLEAGGEMVFVAIGDSITAGYEASRPELSYAGRLEAELRRRYPWARIEFRNAAIGGESSRGGLERLERDVLAFQPDAVTIAYGMNDQNRREDGGNAVPLDEFERNLEAMALRIRERADVGLITPCLPNPRWLFASENARDYAEAIRRVGKRLRLAVADAQRVWLSELTAGKSPESLLLNNLNHPNDYGHGLYFEALAACLPASGILPADEAGRAPSELRKQDEQVAQD